MNQRNTLILVAVLALLAGYVYFFEINKTPEQLSAQLGTPTAPPQAYIFQLDQKQVRELLVRDLRDGREAHLARNEKGWQILKPVNAPADSEKIEQALGYITTLQATRVLTNVTDIKQFGLGNATLELRVTMQDGAPFALTVGDKTADGASYYVAYTGATNQVFIVSTFVLEGAKVLLDKPPLEPTPLPPPTATRAPSDNATPPAATPKP
ncbi:MAG: DUF4340 domain-containing protein [Chloroflexi bacterium]|nr:DUF4340 domain-containing protein [Chloroflexota bacterium]